MPPSRDQNQNTTNSPTNPEIPRFLIPTAYLYLTFNSISTIYQAYTHRDFPMVAFVVFVYLGYFFLTYCITQLQALPLQESSPRKDFLKSVIWGLTTVIFLGFAYEFTTFIHPFAAVLVFAFVILASSFIFFLYFVYDGNLQQEQQQSAGSSYRIRVQVLGFSSCGGKVCDSKIKQAVPGPENV